jgi:putative PIN family toxin of toxin-antitoxin system
VRVVLDVNVLISSAISPTGAPARLVRAWRDGAFDVIVSPGLLAELGRAAAYQRVRAVIDTAEFQRLSDRLARNADLVEDPGVAPSLRSGDPDDDYLIALAAAHDAFLVTGDSALLALRNQAPILTPGEFLAFVEEFDRSR